MAKIVGSGTVSQRAALREGDYTLLKRMMLDQSRMQPPMQKAEPSVGVDAISSNDASGKNKSNVNGLHDDIDDTKYSTEKNLKFQKAYNSIGVPLDNDPFSGRSPSHNPDSETTFKSSEEKCEKEENFDNSAACMNTTNTRTKTGDDIRNVEATATKPNDFIFESSFRRNADVDREDEKTVTCGVAHNLLRHRRSVQHSLLIVHDNDGARRTDGDEEAKGQLEGPPTIAESSNTCEKFESIVQEHNKRLGQDRGGGT